jgi:hypothetical protein
VLPIAATTYVATHRCVDAFAKNVTAEDIGALVVDGEKASCMPEPREILSYVLSLAFAICLTFTVTSFLKWRGVFSRPEPSSAWINIAAFVAQMAVLIVAGKAVFEEATVVHRYRFLDVHMSVGMVGFVALWLVFRQIPRDAMARVRAAAGFLARRPLVAWVLAILWIACFTVSSIFRTVEATSFPEPITQHLPYTMGEFAAALNGRIPLVDFFSQYQNLFAILLVPVFKLVGFSITTFTTVMFVFNTLGFVLLFGSLKKVCGSAWIALLLFAPLMAISFYSENVAAGGYSTNAFNYYAVGPLRYLGLFILARLAVFYLEKPNLRRLAIVACASSLVALNNLDFGVPSAAGVLACALLFPPDFGRAGLPRRIASAAAVYGLSAAATLGVYLAAVRLGTGTWPLLSNLVLYQRAFAVLGFFMLPAPRVGLYWVVYLTVISAILIPIYETFSAVHADIARNRRLLNGSLAYSGIAAAGALTYFIGRSHAWVLEAVYCAWAYVTVQLAYRAWLGWRELGESPRAPGAFLIPIPAVAAASVLLLIAPVLLETPSLKEQLFRISTKARPRESVDASLVVLIKKHMRAGDATVIAYQNAHWLALKAGVDNLYPFANVRSMILKEQVNAAMASVARLPTDRGYVFGAPPPDLRVRIEENGFRQVDSLGDFAVWSRTRP